MTKEKVLSRERQAQIRFANYLNTLTVTEGIELQEDYKSLEDPFINLALSMKIVSVFFR